MQPAKYQIKNQISWLRGRWEVSATVKIWWIGAWNYFNAQNWEKHPEQGVSGLVSMDK